MKGTSIKKSSDKLVCFVTCAKFAEAERIAYALVKDKLAACVNIIKEVNSVFSWEGKVHSENEILLIIKTTSKKQKKLAVKIRSLHSYRVPEIIFLKIDSGLSSYLNWLNTQTR